MKKAYLLLTVLLAALLLFTACTDTHDQNDAQPPVSDNGTAQDNVTWKNASGYYVAPDMDLIDLFIPPANSARR